MNSLTDFDTNTGIQTYFKETKLGNTGIVVVKENAEDIELFDLEPLTLDKQLDISTEGFKEFLNTSKDKIKEFIQWIVKQIENLYITIRRFVAELFRIELSLKDIIEDKKLYHNYYCIGKIRSKCKLLVNLELDIFNNYTSLLTNISKHIYNVLSYCNTIDINNEPIELPTLLNTNGFTIDTEYVYSITDDKLSTGPYVPSKYFFKNDTKAIRVKGKELLNRLDFIKNYRKSSDDYFKILNNIKDKVSKYDTNNLDSKTLNKVNLIYNIIPNKMMALFNCISVESYLYLRILAINGDPDNNKALKDIL